MSAAGKFSIAIFVILVSVLIFIAWVNKTLTHQVESYTKNPLSGVVLPSAHFETGEIVQPAPIEIIDSEMENKRVGKINEIEPVTKEQVIPPVYEPPINSPVLVN